jgi:hypothetical protein
MIFELSPWAYAPATVAAIAAGIAAVIGAINQREITGVKKDLTSVKHTSEATHTLSNSAMGQQLRENLATLQAWAVDRHRIAANGQEAEIAAAAAVDVKVEAARKALQDHLTKQAVVDARKVE